MSNQSLLNLSRALVAYHRRKGTPEHRFIADQLDRVAQLLIFTAAETPEQFDDRCSANHEWVKEAEFERGYQEGRASMAHVSQHSDN